MVQPTLNSRAAAPIPARDPGETLAPGRHDNARWVEAIGKLRDLLKREVGIRLPDEPLPFLRTRLRPLCLEHGCSSIPQLIERLSTSSESNSIQALIDAVTTNTTSFFRERHHFEALVRNGIRPWIEDRRRRDHTFRVWSAACSTGQEAYSISLVMDLWAQDPRAQLRLLATDADRAAVSAARRGYYPPAQLVDIPPSARAGAVEKPPDDPLSFTFTAQIKRRIHFAQLNLLSMPYGLSHQCDAIFCRNVLIYFYPSIREAVIRALLESLKPGGLLFLGHAETLDRSAYGVTLIGPTAYRKETP